MIKHAVPLLHVSSAGSAVDFYCHRLGFQLEFSHGPSGPDADPCYVGVSRDGIWMHLSSFSGDGVAGGVVNLIVDDVDALHREFVAKNLTIDMAPTDQTWGTRNVCERRGSQLPALHLRARVEAWAESAFHPRE